MKWHDKTFHTIVRKNQSNYQFPKTFILMTNWELIFRLIKNCLKIKVNWRKKRGIVCKYINLPNLVFHLESAVFGLSKKKQCFLIIVYFEYDANLLLHNALQYSFRLLFSKSLLWFFFYQWNKTQVDIVAKK